MYTVDLIVGAPVPGGYPGGVDVPPSVVELGVPVGVAVADNSHVVQMYSVTTQSRSVYRTFGIRYHRNAPN